VDRPGFEEWLAAYFAAWASNEPDDVAALFTEDATYRIGPFREPWRGRDEIVRRWVTGGADDVRFDYDVIALEGDVGVAHWRVTTQLPADTVRVEQDGVLVITFAPDGRCREHLEWFDRRELD
jgi:uncharacterized protein (TIGR02246 family)